MGAFFFDSSALVKCYIKETGTAWARSLVDAQPPNEIIWQLPSLSRQG